MIRITNNSSQNVFGTFGGNRFDFPKGEPVVIDEEVAEFLFGIGQDSKVPAFNRLNLFYPSGDAREASKVLQQFVMEPVEAHYEAVVTDSTDERPLVNGGVAEAGTKVPAKATSDEDE